MNRAVRNLAFFSIFAVVLSLTLSTSAEARRYRLMCQADHLHYGSGYGRPTRKTALRSAISDWAGFTAFEYGNNYAYWKLARNKRVSCRRSGGRWNCSIEGTPCRRN